MKNKLNTRFEKMFKLSIQDYPTEDKKQVQDSFNNRTSKNKGIALQTVFC